MNTVRRIVFFIIVLACVISTLGVAHAESDIPPIRPLPLFDLRTPVFPPNELATLAALPITSPASIPAIKKPNIFIRLWERINVKPQLRMQFGKPAAIR